MGGTETLKDRDEVNNEVVNRQFPVDLVKIEGTPIHYIVSQKSGRLYSELVCLQFSFSFHTF